MTSRFTGSVACSGFDNPKSDPASPVARKHLPIGIDDVIAALGLSCFVVFRSLMISIDQRIIAERQETFSEPIGGMLLCAGKRLWGSFLGGQISRSKMSDKETVEVRLAMGSPLQTRGARLRIY
jgi:hypothetical protein